MSKILYFKYSFGTSGNVCYDWSLLSYTTEHFKLKRLFSRVFSQVCNIKKWPITAMEVLLGIIFFVVCEWWNRQHFPQNRMRKTALGQKSESYFCRINRKVMLSLKRSAKNTPPATASRLEGALLSSLGCLQKTSALLWGHWEKCSNYGDSPSFPIPIPGEVAGTGPSPLAALTPYPISVQPFLLHVTTHFCLLLSQQLTSDTRER